MAINVNTVYQTVLLILNKEQRGYMTPVEFNKIGAQSQLEIFETYFDSLNQQLRVPQADVDYSDRITNLDEQISIFKTSGAAIYNAPSFSLPKESGVAQSSETFNTTIAQQAYTFTTLTSGQLSNGTVYQKLYNRHAVTDTRNLAPYGYNLATEAMFNNLKTETATGTPGNIKSTDLWTSTSSASNNTSGFNSKPSGQRKAIAANNDFAGLTTEARYWVSDSNKYFYVEDNSNAPTIVTNSNTKEGYAVRVTRDIGFKGWQGAVSYTHLTLPTKRIV